ncbi:RNA polymerase sigma-70 factor OS=Ureibacillus acetophenoni OX=614649 GN=SAMN05877842_11911 PE=3 SV=1 [Ureibacillus acetophenoni]
MDPEILVKRAQLGDKEAFVELIKSLESSLYKVSKAILLSDSECLECCARDDFNCL